VKLLSLSHSHTNGLRYESHALTSFHIVLIHSHPVPDSSGTGNTQSFTYKHTETHQVQFSNKYTPSQCRSHALSWSCVLPNNFFWVRLHDCCLWHNLELPCDRALTTLTYPDGYAVVQPSSSADSYCANTSSERQIS